MIGDSLLLFKLSSSLFSFSVITSFVVLLLLLLFWSFLLKLLIEVIILLIAATFVGFVDAEVVDVVFDKNLVFEDEGILELLLLFEELLFMIKSSVLLFVVGFIGY